jgi:hypothetical protein
MPLPFALASIFLFPRCCLLFLSPRLLSRHQFLAFSRLRYRSLLETDGQTNAAFLFEKAGFIWVEDTFVLERKETLHDASFTLHEFRSR